MKDKILTWFGTGSVGASSKAMALAVIDMPNDGSHPCDPDDFNRCLLLLSAVPEIRQHMEKVAEINETWRNIVASWDKVEACFLAEVGINWTKSNRAPITYDMMKSIGC